MSNTSSDSLSKPSDMVRGATETMLTKLEESLGSRSGNPADVLQTSEPGPLDETGTDVEDVLNVISQSIFRESGIDGKMKNFD